MGVSPQVKPVGVDTDYSPVWEEMGDPLHPMHWELRRRMAEASASDLAIDDGKWSRAARLATIFYLGLGSWGALGGLAYLGLRLAGRG